MKTTTNFQDLLTDPTIDAIAVATPVSTHFEFGMATLKAGKHLWLEKPMTETSLQARKLVDEAAKRQRVLFVDHTFIYTGAVRKMGEIIKSGELGRVYYYDSTRVNLGLFQRDVSVISDLAVHDFSILDYLLGEHPIAVSASGTNHFPGTPGEPGLHHAVLRFWNHRPRERQLARAGQGAADPRRRQQEDDHLRRPRAEREDQGLRQGRQLHRRSQADPRDAGRLPDRRHVGAEARRAPRRCASSAEHFVDCIENSKVPETDGQARPARRRVDRGRHQLDARQGRDRLHTANKGRHRDSVRRSQGAVRVDQDRGQRRHPGRARQLPVHARAARSRRSRRSSPPIAAPVTASA